LNHQPLSSLISLQQGISTATLLVLRGIPVTYIPLQDNNGEKFVSVDISIKDFVTSTTTCEFLFTA
jgi:hypothetical protein